jgi:hypothetical protein
MKICNRCFQEFAEDENLYDSLASELADILLESTITEGINDLCLQCREELGTSNLMGFKQ